MQVILRVMYIMYDRWPLRPHCSKRGNHVFLCRVASRLDIIPGGSSCPECDKD